MIPLATIIARKLGKRMGKVATEAQEKSGHLNRYFVDLFKNHKIIKIFQRENYENIRSEDYVNALKDKSIKIRSVYLRSTPIMEVLTGFMIALLIFYSGHLIISGELSINNFFSFLANTVSRDLSPPVAVHLLRVHGPRRCRCCWQRRLDYLCRGCRERRHRGRGGWGLRGSRAAACARARGPRSRRPRPCGRPSRSVPGSLSQILHL